MTNAGIETVYGVDFSGAKEAGQNIWIATTQREGSNRLKLARLDRLGDLVGTTEREKSLSHLVQLILSSDRALWGIDFPFALPIEIVPAEWGLKEQFAWVKQHVGDAYSFGRECVEAALRVGDKMHIRRQTDRETKTPFDCYHYRIICQTFHGMREVLSPIYGKKGTLIYPFERLKKFDRVVVESCPGSTLKRWGVPHNNYKQPTGSLEPHRIRNRKIIAGRLRETVDISASQWRVMNGNPGGDALDAVIAAAGVWEAWQMCDFNAVWRNQRYLREGRIFA